MRGAKRHRASECCARSAGANGPARLHFWEGFRRASDWCNYSARGRDDQATLLDRQLRGSRAWARRMRRLAASDARPCLGRVIRICLNAGIEGTSASLSLRSLRSLRAADWDMHAAATHASSEGNPGSVGAVSPPSVPFRQQPIRCARKPLPGRPRHWQLHLPPGPARLRAPSRRIGRRRRDVYAARLHSPGTD